MIFLVKILYFKGFFPERKLGKTCVFHTQMSFFQQKFNTLMMSKSEERKKHQSILLVTRAYQSLHCENNELLEMTRTNRKQQGQAANCKRPEHGLSQVFVSDRIQFRLWLCRTGSAQGYQPQHTAIDNRLLRTGGQVTPTLGILLTTSQSSRCNFSQQLCSDNPMMKKASRLTTSQFYHVTFVNCVIHHLVISM